VSRIAYRRTMIAHGCGSRRAFDQGVVFGKSADRGNRRHDDRVTYNRAAHDETSRPAAPVSVAFFSFLIAALHTVSKSELADQIMKPDTGHLGI
jgi:hypothetical protein